MLLCGHGHVVSSWNLDWPYTPYTSAWYVYLVPVNAMLACDTGHIPSCSVADYSRSTSAGVKTVQCCFSSYTFRYDFMVSCLSTQHDNTEWLWINIASLRVFLNRMLGKASYLRREKVMYNWRKLQNEKLHNLRVACMDGGRYVWCTEFHSENVEGKTTGDIEP